MIGVFWAMVIGNLLVISVIYLISAEQDRRAALRQLEAIGEFKERAIHRWRRERIDHASDLPEIAGESPALDAMLKGHAGPAERQRALRQLQQLALANGEADLSLLDASGRPILSTVADGTPHPATLQRLPAIAQGTVPELLEVYFSPSGDATIDMVVPLFTGDHQHKGFLVGRIRLLAAVQNFVGQWLGKSATGAVSLLLAAPQPMRLTPGHGEAKNFLPQPVSEQQEAMYRAAQVRATESFESVDENDRPVLVVARPVEGTGWILVTSMTVAEVLENARRQVIYLAIGSLLLIALCALAVMRLWRLQNERELARWRKERARQQEVLSLQKKLNEAQRFGRMGSWERDLASGTVWWSEGMCALFGVGSGEPAPQNISQVIALIYPDDRARFIAATAATLAPGGRSSVDFRIVLATPDGGTIRHLHHQWQQIRNAENQPVRLVGTTHDITEQVDNETALRDQLDMLTTLIDNVPGGVTLFDRELRLRFYNRQYQVLLDFPDDLFKDPHPSLESFVRYNAWRGDYGPGDPEQLARNAVEQASQPVPDVSERERPDGSAIEIRSAPLAGGGFVTIYTDITARKQAEQQQRLSEKIIATSPTAILITNPQNNIVFVNPAFSAITGYTLQEAAGKNPRILSAGRHDKAFYTAFWDELNRNDSWSGEIWDRRKDGNIYPKWLSVYVLRNAAGRLTNYVAMFTDITERKQAEQKIHHLAHHDPLTGLANRLALESKLDHAIADAERYQSRVALLFIDLDRFKMVNDSLGHAVGDLMLMEIAGRLTERLRASDVVARLGGDEFVIVLPNLHDTQHAAMVAQWLLDDIGKPIKAPTTELHTSGSIGIAVYPGDGTTVEALMQSADTAMYEAKASGRNAFRFFTREMTDSANNRLELENDLRSALIEQQFELHYQPQVAPADGRIVGVEALLRWRHRDKGMIGPDRFIPVAEETGLIVDIGAWVLREGCRQARCWIDAGVAVRMSINLSARQLRCDNLLPMIEQTLDEYRLPKHALELEITESALMEQPDQAIAILHEIKSMGVALALDDFGTGYSSLAYLKRFPIDRLKIDRSFVRDIETDPNDRVIALSTIALAHSLGLQVTAEGVEDEAQRDFLREHGCDEAQGWLYSKAVPAEVAEKLLRQTFLP